MGEAGASKRFDLANIPETPRSAWPELGWFETKSPENATSGH